MTAVELRTRSDDELKQTLNDLKDELFGLKFQQILGQLEDTTVLKKTRKDIARIKTVLREKEMKK
ncbi:50S ribosomal protein L29 [Candidatus Poribacteria bacterium]|nr:50S ribosomal protein L29 [Candidatus Poribacteria bacterium]